MAISATAVAALERDAWFSGLSAELKSEILRRAVSRRVHARGMVYGAADPPTGMFAVLSGEVRLLHYTPSGKFAFYKIMHPGDVFGLLSELDGLPRFSDATAALDSVLLHLGHAEVQALYRENPAARDAFVDLICRNLRTTLSMLVEEHTSRPLMHVAQILVSIFSREPAADGSHKLTQEAVAAMAGISRQTASKVLHELQSDGLIRVQYGKIEPLDLDALSELTRSEH